MAELDEADLAGVSGGFTGLTVSALGAAGAWLTDEGSGGAGAFLDWATGCSNDSNADSAVDGAVWAATPTSVGVAGSLYKSRNNHSAGGYGGL